MTLGAFKTETNTLRRLVMRRYERDLVRRGLVRERTSIDVAPANDGEDDVDGLPDAERLPEMTPALREELDDWLDRVVLEDKETGRRWRARALDAAFARTWRARASPGFVDEPIGRESALGRGLQSAPEDADSSAPPEEPELLEPIADHDQEGPGMGELTEKQQAVADGVNAGRSDAQIAEDLGTTTKAVGVMRCKLKKLGVIANVDRRKPEKAVARRGRAVSSSAQRDASDEALIGSLKERLAQIDAKRAPIVALIQALGGQV